MRNAAKQRKRSRLLAALPLATPPRTQWRLLETAFSIDLSPGGIAVLVPVTGVAAFLVSFQPVWLAWAFVTLAALVGRARLAAVFGQQSWSAEPTMWVMRHRVGAWAQSTMLGLGGAYAIWSGNPVSSLLLSGCIAFVAAADSASASLAGTARGQAALTLGLPIIAGLATGHSWGLALAALSALELVSCLFMVERGVAQALKLSAAQTRAEEALPAEHGATAPAVEDFQRLLGRDQATGLPNRHGFLRILAAESRRAYDAAMPLSLVLVSYENVPEVTVEEKPALKEAHLSAVASAIRQSLYRVMDQMACLAPERLAVLLPFTDALGADVVARKIAALLRPEGSEEKGPLGNWAYACIGVATYTGKGMLPEMQLLEFAMQAEASARKAGGDRIARFDPLAATMRRDKDVVTAPPPMLALSAPIAALPAPEIALPLEPGVLGRLDGFEPESSKTAGWVTTHPG